MNPLCSPLFLLNRFARCGAAFALVLAANAHADSYAKITSLLNSGKPGAALTAAEQRLAKTPRDPQLQFLRARAQAELGNAGEAIASLTELTQQYPELAEPYNNLGVLYAAQSQLDQARAAFEAAIRANPAYATAHENLGDIQARLAGRSYQQSLRLDGLRAKALEPKLALVQQLSAIGAAPARATPPIQKP